MKSPLFSLANVFIILFTNSLPTSAAEFYPPKPTLRLFGTNQGNVGDCAAEAEVTALEQAFSNHGFAVRFSLFHRHAFNWVSNSAPPTNMKLALNDTDVRILKESGEFVPEYAWPETTEGYRPEETGIRPRPSESLILDPDLPLVKEFGFKKDFFTFADGWANTGDLKMLKRAIDSRDAVVLSVHDALLLNLDPDLQFNKATGLMVNKYNMNALDRAIKAHKSSNDYYTGITHAVAAVGYDDSLYADAGYSIPGAIIIRNSWNNSEELEAVRKIPSGSEGSDLTKFRLKISSVNLPGYYAIPYQYIIDRMSKQSKSGFQILSMDYASYARTHSEVEQRYQTLKVPYSCKSSDYLGVPQSRKALFKLQKYKKAVTILQSRDYDLSTRKEVTRHFQRLLQEETITRNVLSKGTSKFRFATLARNSSMGIDRVSDFYSGKFRDYYCGGNDIWPNAAIASRPGFQLGIEAISSNPYLIQNWMTFFDGAIQSGALEADVTPSSSPLK